ncbi:MAG: hypothetical protein LBO04_05335 [Spirochaetaceae bacterium]|nr:hypothetical protein [Spirochaetaceae bacterium]
MFEGAAKTFGVRRPDIAGKSAERKARALEEKLREKDGVVAELPAGTREGEGTLQACGVRPRSGKRADEAAFFRLYPLPAAPAPG